ncbi:hypothetical protein GYMLUDRAFT_50595 [Collybiopsis luxurians FD-317 M1]|uniref:Uncharacterized protein n=1 Tax=Collybiopsis luxurians FD-317 M1 TaxID=944289 RepID=A0A0D0C967_9AGAR|nr:hypothetical protein GYMLUDRAFT_50595 [Collybiopsis luxurians FD-317 M1]
MSTKPVDAWLERSRLDGMILDGFTYGIFFLLSIQASIAVYRSSRSRHQRSNKRTTRILQAYIGVTFILATIGVGANARYTEDIWINFRGQEGWSPDLLIENEFNYWYNRLAVDSQEVLVWIMNALLFYRCCRVWSNAWWVVLVMGLVYLAIFGLSISVMVFAGEKAVFTNLSLQTSFLALSCTYNLLFTILVSTRLLTVRSTVRHALSPEHAELYTSITTTLVESASLYFVFDLIFLVSFAVHSNVENLILLENSLIQGIAQLLIIIRVAEGREYDDTKRIKAISESTATLTHLQFGPQRRRVTGVEAGTGNLVEVELVPMTEDGIGTTSVRDFSSDVGGKAKPDASYNSTRVQMV